MQLGARYNLFVILINAFTCKLNRQNIFLFQNENVVRKATICRVCFILLYIFVEQSIIVLRTFALHIISFSLKKAQNVLLLHIVRQTIVRVSWLLQIQSIYSYFKIFFTTNSIVFWIHNLKQVGIHVDGKICGFIACIKSLCWNAYYIIYPLLFVDEWT